MLISRLMRLFFHLLYHPFAWAYDLVAAAVSMGRWRRWVLSSVEMLPPGPTLELGHGPGHLMTELRRLGRPVVGIDASRQMSRLAQRNLRRSIPAAPTLLARARGQALPFPNAAFATVVATFPAPYISEPDTLAEVRRVLQPGGRLVILLAVRITGYRLPDRALRLIYRLTGETPTPEQIEEFICRPYARAGFIVESVWVERPGGRLFYLIAVPQIR